MLRLKTSKSFVHQGLFKYLVTYDHSSGRKNRYTVVIPTSDDPVTIGRELDLKMVRSLINEFECFFKGQFWFGDRETAERVVARFFESR